MGASPYFSYHLAVWPWASYKGTLVSSKSLKWGAHYKYPWDHFQFWDFLSSFVPYFPVKYNCEVERTEGYLLLLLFSIWIGWRYKPISEFLEYFQRELSQLQLHPFSMVLLVVDVMMPYTWWCFFKFC